MRILLIWLTVALFLASAGLGLPFCPQEITQPCQITSPDLNNCANFSYSILNGSGSVIEQRPLAPWNLNQWYFNLTNKTAGYYMVRLCDNSTKEVVVMNSLLAAGTGLDPNVLIDINPYSTPGVMILIFLALIYIIILVFSFAHNTPILDIFAALTGVFLGAVVFFTISKIFGVIVIFMGLGSVFKMLYEW